MKHRISQRWLLASILLAWTSLTADDRIDFNRDVRPILSNHCFQCHGPDENHREADLRLDVEEVAKADRDGSYAINPHDLAESELLARITSDDPDEVMPPRDLGKALTDTQIRILKRWIEQGAPWQRHWAYLTPVKNPVPQVSSTDSNNWIDHFISDRLAKHQIQPAPQANPIMLIRRLSFDLTGLPPTPRQVDRLPSNFDAQTYVSVVDRMLASPAFGERMAVYWLDLVRYADTVGYHGDQDHAITPYRDYVIDSFNDDKPFDEFTREQLAGDLLPNATTQQRIATGYNRLLQTSHEGGVQPKEYLAIYAADRVRNVSAVWLGGTLGCAQCHDHKFDPFSSVDFYSMAAFFADVDEEKHFKVGSNALPTKRPPEIRVLKRSQREHRDSIQRQRASNPDDERLVKKLDAAIHHLESQQRPSMVTVSLTTPRTTRVFPRGNWLDESGPIVQPAVPAFLGTVASDETRATRLDLAHWLTDRDQAGLLTARVFVNRLWYLFFGRGLCKSLDDFGGQGQPPDHPELLDNLAWEFVDSGWDVKHLVRLIVTSRTYQRSSIPSSDHRRLDPENQWFARQARFRLPAEMIRDNALAVSGLLVNEIGGASAKPYQPSGYYRHLNFPTRKYRSHSGANQYRRGVYVHWQRQFLHPMLKAFDAPSREECSTARPKSNTPLAALTLLNDPSFFEAARELAERVLLEAGPSREDKIRYAFQLATSRFPDDFEIHVLKQLLSDSLKEFQDDENAAKEMRTIGLSPIPSDINLNQLASWTSVSRAILNLSEATTRQ